MTLSCRIAPIVPALALALATLAGPVHAQPKGSDPAAAEALFQRGVDRLKKGDWAEACTAFDASMKLDPSVGTQINVARCADHDGRVASAWAGYKKAKALNAETPLEKRKANVDTFVDGEIKKLEPRLPWVTVKMKVVPLPGGTAAAPSAISGLVIKRDDAVVPVEGLDVEVPIDPGKHTFTASAASYRTATVELDFKEGGKQAVVLEIVEEEKPPELPATGPIVPLPPATATPPEDEGMHPATVAGIIIGSIGAAGLITAGVTGGIASLDRGTLDDLVAEFKCVEAAGSIFCTDQASQTEANDAASRGEALALVSTISLFVGGGIAATGIVLIAVGASSGSESEAQPTVGFTPYAAPGAFGGVVSGSF